MKPEFLCKCSTCAELRAMRATSPKTDKTTLEALHDLDAARNELKAAILESPLMRATSPFYVLAALFTLLIAVNLFL